MPDTDFSDSLIARIKAAVGATVKVAERASVYASGGPSPGVVTYSVSYLPTGDSNNRLISVAVDIDIWTNGPDQTESESVAALIYNHLLDWRVQTVRQGSVRLLTVSQSPVPEEDEKLAHITMRLEGRGFRRQLS